MNRSLLTFCLLCHTLVLARAAVHAQTLDAARANTVKAGILLNFIKYTEWPAGTFAKEESPIVLTLVGSTAFENELRRAVAAHNGNAQSQSKKIEIKTLRSPVAVSGGNPSEGEVADFYDQLRRSQAVFVGTSEQPRTAEILNRLKGSDVLTVSENPGFAEAGGMLGMVIHENRVSFDANQGAIQATDVKVSSKVLRLARKIVQSRP